MFSFSGGSILFLRYIFTLSIKPEGLQFAGTFTWFPILLQLTLREKKKTIYLNFIAQIKKIASVSSLWLLVPRTTDRHFHSVRWCSLGVMNKMPLELDSPVNDIFVSGDISKATLLESLMFIKHQQQSWKPHHLRPCETYGLTPYP